MGFRCGIVGLPNVGKTTIFNTLANGKEEISIAPFSTIQPKKGVVPVPDERLEKIVKIIDPKHVVRAHLEFLDVAGLVEGASKGEGMGNQFLSHLRDVDVLLHVVRIFDSEDAVHFLGSIDPMRDIRIVNNELIHKDSETVGRRIAKLEAKKASGKFDEDLFDLLHGLKDALESGHPIRHLDLTHEQVHSLKDIQLFTIKPYLYCVNVSQDDLPGGGKWEKELNAFSEEDMSRIVYLCGILEEEMSRMEDAEKKEEIIEEFLLEKSGPAKVVHMGYELLDKVTFFTHDHGEVRAWTVPKETKAPQAAGHVHSDMERGFIRVEVVKCQDLIDSGSLQKARENGCFKVEGKDYEIQDGDVVHFRFNV